MSHRFNLTVLGYCRGCGNAAAAPLSRSRAWLPLRILIDTGKIPMDTGKIPLT